MFFNKTPKDGLWHPHKPLFFVRLNNGKLSHAQGQIWRRWKDGATAWEYQQEEETEEEFDARQY